MESENNYWLKCVDTDRKGRGNDNVEVEKGSQESATMIIVKSGLMVKSSRIEAIRYTIKKQSQG